MVMYSRSQVSGPDDGRNTGSRPATKCVGILEPELVAGVLTGRMQPAGLAEIDQAKADGRWAAAYSGQAEASVPADLAAALSANPAAEKMFADLNGANRYAVLYRIETAKRAETRSRRIDQFVEMLARGETIHPQQRARPK